MFDKILVAVGGDDESFEPVRAASRLACQLGAELSFLSVAPPTGGTLGEPLYSELLEERLGRTETVLDQARRVAEGEGATVASVDELEGSPAERIVNFARQGGFGLIVVGTRQRGRLQSALLGSVSASVAAHSEVPVMVVPERHLASPERQPE